MWSATHGVAGGATSGKTAACGMIIKQRHDQCVVLINQPLRLENIEIVVAPCEADAQLACMSSLEVKKDGIEAVITEDSDLVAYGCQPIIFKMDQYGNGEEIVLRLLILPFKTLFRNCS